MADHIRLQDTRSRIRTKIPLNRNSTTGRNDLRKDLQRIIRRRALMETFYTIASSFCFGVSLGTFTAYLILKKDTK